MTPRGRAGWGIPMPHPALGNVRREGGTPDRSMLYGALGLSIASVAMLLAGGVLLSFYKASTTGYVARAPRLRLESSWREDPWTVRVLSAAPGLATSGGLAAGGDGQVDVRMAEERIAAVAVDLEIRGDHDLAAVPFQIDLVRHRQLR